MSQSIVFDSSECIPVRLSVRDLVEFIGRSGDLDNRSSRKDAEAMQAGAKMHRKIQKAQGSFYRSEVMLSHTSLVTCEGRDYAITL